MIKDLINKMSFDEIEQWLKTPEANRAEVLAKSIDKLQNLLKKVRGGNKVPHSHYMAGLHPKTLEMLTEMASNSKKNQA